MSPAPEAVAELFRPFAVRVAFVPVAGAAAGDLPFRVDDFLSPQAVPRRRDSFAAGRLAAARATHDLTGRALWPLRDARGAPVWPPGVRGSISHTGDLAVSVVVRGPDAAVGIDLERAARAATPLATASWSCGPEETRRLWALRGSARGLAALRLLCAKEALYKAGPATRHAPSALRSVHLEWTEPEHPGAVVPLTVRARAGSPWSAFTVRTQVLNGYLVAAAAR
ncbi:4'-phosphopantetheinyl transferase superfamily protein [Streptomyces microflavus]|uniref:4'-phosphopantetheinyl transferase superfamily protein n=1 Tax=Streptomyces microflavus TaxID=1919 RepID=UPI0033B23485